MKVAYLGVRYQMVQPRSTLSEELGLESGAFISASDGPAVLAGSPASEADIRGGDVLLSIDDEELNMRNTLAEIISQYRPGDTVTIELSRDGQNRTVNVQLGERP